MKNLKFTIYNLKLISNFKIQISNSCRRQDGFTLAELIISISITVVAGYLLIGILGQSNNIFLHQQSTIFQGMSLNDAGILISDDIKQAVTVAATSPTTPVYTSGATTLVLRIPSIDSAGNVITSSFDYVVVTADSSNNAILRQFVFPTLPTSHRKSQNRVLATNLSTVRFLYFDQIGQPVIPTSATKVNFTLNLKEKGSSIYQQSSASGEVSLRNN